MSFKKCVRYIIFAWIAGAILWLIGNYQIESWKTRNDVFSGTIVSTYGSQLLVDWDCGERKEIQARTFEFSNHDNGTRITRLKKYLPLLGTMNGYDLPNCKDKYPYSNNIFVYLLNFSVIVILGVGFILLFVAFIVDDK